MDDSQDQIYDEFRNNSQVFDNEIIKIEDFLEYHIQNKENYSHSNLSVPN